MFNSYREPLNLFITISSQVDETQANPLSTSIYVIALIPLILLLTISSFFN